MNNVLVTGGAGFIGSNFIQYLLKNEPELRIINLDLLSYAGSLLNLDSLSDPSRHTFVQGDICNAKLVAKLFEQYKIDTVIHFAAESHVDRSISGPKAFVKTNIVGTFTLLECARSYWEKENKLNTEIVRFHHVSTDEVFGSLSSGDSAFDEDTAYSPRSPYSASKAASDHLVRAYYYTYGLPISISNCTNNYGPYQFPEKLIPLVILNAFSGKPLPIYGDGLQIRDWLYVEDHCRAIHKILHKGRIGETYTIGGDNQITNIEIVKTICQILNEKFPDSTYSPFQSLIQYVKDRPGHDRRYAMNITKIKNDLNWRPNYSFIDGIERTVNWYIENTEWVSSIQKQKEYTIWMDKNYSKRGKQK